MHSIYVYTDTYQGLKFFANSCIYIVLSLLQRSFRGGMSTLWRWRCLLLLPFIGVFTSWLFIDILSQNEWGTWQYVYILYSFS